MPSIAAWHTQHDKIASNTLAFVPIQATVPVLWLMPALQLLLLLFFTSVAISHWVYSWLLLAPCLITGMVRSQAQNHHTLDHCH